MAALLLSCAVGRTGTPHSGAWHRPLGRRTVLVCLPHSHRLSSAITDRRPGGGHRSAARRRHHRISQLRLAEPVDRRVHARRAHQRRRAPSRSRFRSVYPIVLVSGYLIDRIDSAHSSARGLPDRAFSLGDNLQRRRLHIAELAERAEDAERERELLATSGPRTNDRASLANCTTSLPTR